MYIQTYCVKIINKLLLYIDIYTKAVCVCRFCICVYFIVQIYIYMIINCGRRVKILKTDVDMFCNT